MSSLDLECSLSLIHYRLTQLENSHTAGSSFLRHLTPSRVTHRSPSVLAVSPHPPCTLGVMSAQTAALSPVLESLHIPAAGHSFLLAAGP